MPANLTTLINQAKESQSQIDVLQKEQDVFLTPTLTDPAQLSSLYQLIQSQFRGMIPREVRLRFVFVAVYLYSPSAIIGLTPIKSGLCRQMGGVINRCRTEVSELFAEARVRYDHVAQFREDIDVICGAYVAR